MSGNSDRGRDQTRCWVLSVENNSIDGPIVVVESLSHAGLRMVLHDFVVLFLCWVRREAGVNKKRKLSL